MGLRITEHKAGSLGEHHGIGVALAALLKVEEHGRERDVGVLLKIFRVDYDAVVLMSAKVESLAVHHIESAEVRRYHLEVEPPVHLGLYRAHLLDSGLLGRIDQSAHTLRAGYKHLACRASVAGKRLAAKLYEIARAQLRRKPELTRNLMPYAPGEVYIPVGTARLPARAENEISLHAHTHVDNGRLLLVGE